MDLVQCTATASLHPRPHVDSLCAAEVVHEAKVGDGELIYIKGCKTTRAQTIVLRGANDYMIDEVER